MCCAQTGLRNCQYMYLSVVKQPRYMVKVNKGAFHWPKDMLDNCVHHFINLNTRLNKYF